MSERSDEPCGLRGTGTPVLGNPYLGGVKPEEPLKLTATFAEVVRLGVQGPPKDRKKKPTKRKAKKSKR